MKNSEAVSTIINQLKYLNKDEHISRRFILSKLRENAKNLIAQKLRDRSLYREDSLESWIDCLQMERIEGVKCDIVEFKSCKEVMRSVKQLPDIIYSKYGAAITKVYSIDGESEYDYTTLRQYSNNKRRKNYGQKFFYIKNNYLYLPDSTTERVNLPVITLETEKIPQLSGCGNTNECKSVWEYEFIGSDKLQKAVIDMTIMELLQSHRQIIPDEQPNLSSHQKDNITI